MNVARFIAFCGKLEYGRSGCIFAYISMTTRARDFKFAGTPVQRLQLAMVTLTQKSFSAQYAWFSRGGSHIYTILSSVLCSSSDLINCDNVRSMAGMSLIESFICVYCV